MYSGLITIGTCNLCGGSVVQYYGPWLCISPPVPYCSKCGAIPKRYVPVIDMENPWIKPSKPVWWLDRGPEINQQYWA